MKKPIVAITRPKDRAEKACQIVKNLGGSPILASTLDLQPVNTDSLKYLVENKNSLDWIVFTSPTTIKSLNLFYPDFFNDLTCKIAVIGIPRTSSARPTLPDGLKKLDNKVILAEAYKSLPPAEDNTIKELIAKIEKNEIDAITFTSPLTVHNLFKIFDKDNLSELLNNLLTVSIGPVTSNVLNEYNVSNIYPDTYTVPDMMELLFNEWKKQK